MILHDRFTSLLALFVACAGLIMGGSALVLRNASQQMFDTAQRQLHSVQLTDELRHSSDDLSRLVRSYLMTGDVRYKRAFEDVLAIRAGQLPRPREYQRVYWDLVLAAQASPEQAATGGAYWYARPRPDGPAVPLRTLMQQAGFTSGELDRLVEAEQRSLVLAGMENKAIALLEGRNGVADAARARAMVFSPAYDEAKRDIMAPIDECAELVAVRTRAEMTVAEQRLRDAQLVFAATFGGLLLMAALLVVHGKLRTRKILGTTPENLQQMLKQMADGPPPAVEAGPAAGALAHLHVTAERLRQLVADNASLEQQIVVRSNELKQVMSELIQNQTLAALGGIVAGVAHELNTPIGNALLATSALDEQIGDFRQRSAMGQLRRSQLDFFLAESGNACAIVSRNLQRSAELIEAFKLVAVDQASSRRKHFDLQTLVRATILALEPMYKKRPVAVVCQIPAGIMLDSYPGALEQVLINLVSNAIHHGLEGREALRVDIEARQSQDAVLLTVRDDGSGMAPEVQKRAFEPFFTTRMGNGGSGLGLYMVHQLTHLSLGGSVVLHSVPGQGTSFDIRLPVQIKTDALAAA